MGRKALVKALPALLLAVCFAVGFCLPLQAAELPLPEEAQPEAATEKAPPAVPAEAYVVMDAATGQVLVAQNAHQMEYPASITKIMTMALVLELIDYEAVADDLVEVSAAAVEALIPRATMIALQPGEAATVRDLLYATKIESANDASHALAEYVAGSMEAFAALMTAKAQALGLENSSFSNPSGQPAGDHMTTAYDMAVITRWALSVPGFRELFGATQYDMPPTNLQPRARGFNNANLALVPHSSYYCEGVTGSKTGYTDQALYTLATTARRGDTELICIVMRCPANETKYTATNALLDYCFNNFSRISYPLQSAGSHQVPVYGGGQQALGEIEVFGEGTVEFLMHNSLAGDMVWADFDIPERYVMGQPFAPAVTIGLPTGMACQQGGTLVSQTLSWSGIEGVLAANTKSGNGFDPAPPQAPLGMQWLLPAAGLAILLAALLLARHRRSKRRRQKLLALKASQPVTLASRPPPQAAALPRNPAGYRASGAAPALKVVQGAGGSVPRRVGQAR